MESNKYLSDRIYNILKSATEECPNDDCDCLICFLRTYMCACGNVTRSTCYKCKNRVCESCENYENDRIICKECFKINY